MSSSFENTARGAPQAVERREVVLDLATARSMLPLVRRIVDDILQHRGALLQLGPEQERLDRQRRDLSWPQRQRRYQIHEEVALAEGHVQEAQAELAGLGLVLLDLDTGRVGFPTVVNGRHSYFSWQPGEASIYYWHFPDEAARRPIPQAWAKAAPGGGRAER